MTRNRKFSHSCSRANQRGAALLVAMLIVVLVASLAAAASWQQWSNIQAETDARAKTQADWLIRGAVDWSKIILFLDKNSTSSDNLNEPWALPLAEARLSTFLTADNNVAQDANTDMTDAFFSGGVTDLQSRLNVANLVNNNTVDSVAVQQFQRLFEALNLPTEQVAQMAQLYLSASLQSSETATAHLSPVCTEQLNWLGLDNHTIAQIRPYVSVLPTRTKINLNTAPEIVLWASLVDADQALAAKLLAVRQFQPFENMDSVQAIASDAYTLDTKVLDVSSDYFLVAGKLRLDTLETHDEFVLRREGNRLRTIRRECQQIQ